MKKVHQRMRDARREKYRSMAEFAKAFGLIYTTYQGHENGARGMTVEEVRKYAAMLEKPITFFFEDHEYKQGAVAKHGLNEAPRMQKRQRVMQVMDTVDSFSPVERAEFHALYMINYGYTLEDKKKS